MWKPAPFSRTPMINHGWVQLFGAPGRQMTPKLVHKLGLRNVLGGRLGRELGFGGRCPMGAGGSGSFGRDLPAAQIRRWAGGTRWEARSGPGAKPGPDCTGNLAGTCVGTAVPAGSSYMCGGTGVHRWCSRSSVGNACLGS